MSKISNLDYAAFNLSGDNYFPRALDTKINLRSKELGDAIIEGNNETDKSRYRAISIIRHYLTEGLKDQYLTMENPLDLWTAYSDDMITCYYQRLNMSGRISDSWTIKVTEKELLDKTFSTFHSTNVLLQQQYRERGFASYTYLISCLLLAEANNELLMKNSEMRPIGTAALPEANEAEKKDPKECNHVHDDKRSHGKGRSRNKGRGRDNYSYGLAMAVVEAAYPNRLTRPNQLVIDAG
ncbi:uncharacterized protein LOC125591939 [Brassica napus]|uniref:uncharacterized protein LOC106454362 n=1 Tax=Brassica napus TaxID=3708 RepID=UPI0006AAA83B|nr:uncharacterized protein LOC106454362 [Brassica napus]XP_048622824.1 uncharacterized protein LOC125591939 [Brassica napus]